MKSIPFCPPLSDFIDLANSFLFNQEDIDFQKQKALEVGYTSWEDYLKTVYLLLTRLFNLEAIAKDLVTLTEETIFLSGSFMLSLERNQNTEIIKTMDRILTKVEALPDSEYKRVAAFQNKMVLLFHHKILENIKADPKTLEFVQQFTSDVNLQNQVPDLQSKTTYTSSASVIDSFAFLKTNGFIRKNNSRAFYFPSKYYLLPKLYDTLLALKYIKANNNFQKSFETKSIPPSVQATEWLADNRKLFYLLYRLNNQKEYFEGMSIDKIAQQLFSFKTKKSSNSMRTGFTNCLPKFEDPDYLEKKMPTLKTLLDNL